MKFSEKYEILEMVTSGRVSTFLAKERTTHESVMVYTFECSRRESGEWSMASILARFCSLAPDPPGVIVKAWFDETSSSGFIATKTPDPSALKEWVRAYQSFTPSAKQARVAARDETAELNSLEVNSALSQSNRSQSQPLGEDAHEGTSAGSIGAPKSTLQQSVGEFTRLFPNSNAFGHLPSSAPKTSSKTADGDGALGNPLTGDTLTPASSTKSASGGTIPGAFTREFLAITHGPLEEASRTPAPSPAPPQPQPRGFTEEFLVLSQEASTSPNEPLQGCGEPSKPRLGDLPLGTAEDQTRFTEYFRNPFDQPGRTEKSAEVWDFASAESVKPVTSDDSRFFNRDGIERGQMASEQGQRPEERSITEILDESAGVEGGARLGPSTLDSQSGGLSLSEPSGNLTPSIEWRGATQPAPPPLPDLFSPVRPAPVSSSDNQTFVRHSSTDRATDFLRVPSGEAPRVEEAQSSPSEWDAFIENQGRASVAPVPPLAAGSAGRPPVLVPPAVPHPGPFQCPPVPPRPQAMNYPPVSAPSVLGAPPVPRPMAPAVGTPSIWPLITVLTVLLAAGVLLVMYFALKR